ncbi:transcriptional regulator [Pseudomonas cichorii]|uniref:IclR family transcriptional regulator n=1 Tax=Pseudomonas serbiensis TaxID=3064350 RepID=A0ABT9CJJ9_9PSED|nr:MULTISPECIES: IclR family transcriptional regulator [Pseudomonas]MDO7925664.1 IclR family transcriptional regulator [Pseudomonas sp. KFB-138]GFM88522.1 transcriptional regulator [Pseudomonas cichorii]
MPTNSTPESDDSTEATAGGVAAVDRAFAILAAFDSDRPSLPLAEISRRTGLYKSTILRLMTSLERGGFVRRLADGQFAIGHEPLRLAQLYQGSFNLRDALLPILEALSQECAETSSFYVAQGASRVVLLRVEPKRSVRVSIHEGDRFPINAGASGKVLRAFGAAKDPSLQAVREQCWAASFGERDPDTAAISVPVFGAGNILAGALTLSGPADRFNAEQIKRVRSTVLRKAAQATAALGGVAETYVTAINATD